MRQCDDELAGALESAFHALEEAYEAHSAGDEWTTDDKDADGAGEDQPVDEQRQRCEGADGHAQKAGSEVEPPIDGIEFAWESRQAVGASAQSVRMSAGPFEHCLDYLGAVTVGCPHHDAADNGPRDHGADADERGQPKSGAADAWEVLIEPGRERDHHHGSAESPDKPHRHALENLAAPPVPAGDRGEHRLQLARLLLAHGIWTGCGCLGPTRLRQLGGSPVPVGVPERPGELVVAERANEDLGVVRGGVCADQRTPFDLGRVAREAPR